MLQFLKVLLGITLAIIGSLGLLALGEILLASAPIWILWTIGIITVSIPFILLIVAETLRIKSYKKLKEI